MIMKEKLIKIICDGVMWDLTRRWFWIINLSVNLKAAVGDQNKESYLVWEYLWAA